MGGPFEGKLPFEPSAGKEEFNFGSFVGNGKNEEEFVKGSPSPGDADGDFDQPQNEWESDTADTGDHAETEADAEAEEVSENEAKTLEARAQELEQENEELRNRLLRLQADFDNYRKRMRSEMGEIQERANLELIQKILPILDNLKRAASVSQETPEAQTIQEGVEKIARQLEELLEKEGVTPIECEGQPFDPTCHEAVMQEHSEEHPPNTVLEELQRGYKMKDKIVRPSIVKVSSVDSSEGQEQ